MTNYRIEIMEEAIKDFGFNKIKSSKKENKDIIFIKDVGFNNIDMVSIVWYSCNANLLQVQLYPIDCDDPQIIELGKVNEQSMFTIIKTIKEAFAFNPSNHWIGYDEYRYS